MDYKEKIKELCKRYEPNEVSKMLGLPIYDLYRISGLPVDCGGGWDIIYEMYMKNLLPEIYEGFRVEMGYDGVLNWDKASPYGNGEVVKIYAMATPFWDGECRVPVSVEMWDRGTDINIGDGDEIFYSYDTPTEFNDIEELLVWFRDIYLPKTSKIINNLVSKNFSYFEDTVEEYR